METHMQIHMFQIQETGSKRHEKMMTRQICAGRTHRFHVEFSYQEWKLWWSPKKCPGDIMWLQFLLGFKMFQICFGVPLQLGKMISSFLFLTGIDCNHNRSSKLSSQNGLNQEIAQIGWCATSIPWLQRENRWSTCTGNSQNDQQEHGKMVRIHADTAFSWI